MKILKRIDCWLYPEEEEGNANWWHRLQGDRNVPIWPNGTLKCAVYLLLVAFMLLLLVPVGISELWKGITKAPL